MRVLTGVRMFLMGSFGLVRDHNTCFPTTTTTTTTETGTSFVVWCYGVRKYSEITTAQARKCSNSAKSATESSSAARTCPANQV